MRSCKAGARFYEAGKVTALVCHATCLLLDARLSNGDLLVTGKTWTGFATSEEKFADSFVGQRIQPFWIEDEAGDRGHNFVVDQMFREFAVRDGLLVTASSSTRARRRRGWSSRRSALAAAGHTHAGRKS